VLAAHLTWRPPRPPSAAIVHLLGDSYTSTVSVSSWVVLNGVNGELVEGRYSQPWSSSSSWILQSGTPQSANQTTVLRYPCGGGQWVASRLLLRRAAARGQRRCTGRSCCCSACPRALPAAAPCQLGAAEVETAVEGVRTLGRVASGVGGRMGSVSGAGGQAGSIGCLRLTATIDRRLLHTVSEHLWVPGYNCVECRQLADDHTPEATRDV
jgi:hypothetical protein